jgi:hypothetical protein
MSKYKIENHDGRLALVGGGEQLEWLDEIEIISFPSESEICVRVTLCDGNASNLYAWDLDDADEIRAAMSEWLEDSGYSESIHGDFRSEESTAEAVASARALRDRFLGGDYTPLDARYCVWWSSEDEQGSIDCGGFITIEEARASLPGMTAELLRVGNEDDAAGILAGTFLIAAVRDNTGCGFEESLNVADVDFH